MTAGYLYILLAIVGTAAGQTFIKAASARLNAISVKKIVFCPFIYFGFVSIAIVPFFVNLALDSIPLSLVYAFTGIHFITVPISAHVFLREKLTRNTIIGMACVAFGVVLFNI